MRTDLAGRFDGVSKTPQGGLRVPAALTRVGVLRYRDGQGREWGELRLPEEVFAADALATLRGAPVVDLHPAEEVRADNWRALSVGHVHDDVRPEGDLVVATLTVQDAAEVQRVEAGERREVSCGYTCELEAAPGTYQGERYDAIQRGIRYNHVGLGPTGWGRAGAEVSLRLDGAAVEVRRDAPKGNAVKKTLKVKGREYKLDAEEDVAAAQGAVDEQQSKADAEGAELAAVKAALMDALQKVAALEAKLAAANAATPPAVSEDMVPEAVADSIATKRLALWDEARKVLGADAKLDGMTTAQIRAAVVTKALPTVKLDGLSADTVDGMYRAAVAGAASHNDALANAARAAVPAGGASHNDTQDPAEAARVATANRWKQPLSVSGGKAS